MGRSGRLRWRASEEKVEFESQAFVLIVIKKYMQMPRPIKPKKNSISRILLCVLYIHNGDDQNLNTLLEYIQSAFGEYPTTLGLGAQEYIHNATIYDIHHQYPPARISSPPMINILMEYNFTSWQKRRRHLAPEADRILPLVVAARTAGMSRVQIGNAIALDQEVLNELLAGMVQIGWLTVGWRDGLPVYRAGVRSV